VRKYYEEVVRIDKLVPGGQGMGVMADGRKIFVWNALPGEVVRVEVGRVKKSYAEGVAVEILEASSRRVRSRDDCYLATSPWQVMDYEFEVAQKAGLVVESFGQNGVVNLTGMEVVGDGRDFYYRNKMEYALWWDNDMGRIDLAFHRRGSHQKVPIGASSIERAEVLAEARRVVGELNGRGEAARKYQSLLVRCSQGGEVSSGLFENGRPRPRMGVLSDWLLGREFRYSPNGFFQINLPVYEMALVEIQRWLGDGAVVDMYAGVGSIGLAVAGGRRLTLVEADDNAFREMKNNVFEGAAEVRTVCARSDEAIEYITCDITLIVDPPRAGLEDAVVGAILERRPRRVIYLSCNPVTQARDVARLLARYEIVGLRGFNFFPRTPHVENLVVLEAIF
jgi:23S rRNA (uracil1939-C5)-methyltransferase